MRINLNALIFALLLLGAAVLKVLSSQEGEVPRAPASLKEAIKPIPEQPCPKTKQSKPCQAAQATKKMPPGGRSEPASP